MREPIVFEIPGKPRAKQSGRVTRTEKGIRFYPSTNVENYHGRVAALTRAAIPAPIEGAVALRLSVVLQTPTSWSKKRKARLNYATRTPDLDNVAKAVMDGMGGIAWIDDKQVVELVVEKHYGTVDRVLVAVREL